MRIFLISISFSFFSIAYSQNAVLSKCWRYEVDCFTETFLALSIQNVKDKPDTSYQLLIAEVIALNKFLEAHQNFKTETNPKPIQHYDIRTVFLFGDNSGKRHELGFDCFGNYELDGIPYSKNDHLTSAIAELKIGN